MKNNQPNTQQHPLEQARWGLIGIMNYRGVLVSKMIGKGYSCLNTKCKTTQEVDQVIDNALKTIGESILK